MKVKKIISLILLISISIILVGCGNKSEITSQQNSNTQPNSTTANAEAYDKGYLEISDKEIKGMEK